MKEHNWATELVDGGHLGCAEFWRCLDCGASGGPVLFTKNKRWNPFYADGSGLKLTEDCEESKRLIEEHLKKPRHIRSNK